MNAAEWLESLAMMARGLGSEELEIELPDGSRVPVKEIGIEGRSLVLKTVPTIVIVESE